MVGVSYGDVDEDSSPHLVGNESTVSGIAQEEIEESTLNSIPTDE